MFPWLSRRDQGFNLEFVIWGHFEVKLDFFKFIPHFLHQKYQEQKMLRLNTSITWEMTFTFKVIQA